MTYFYQESKRNAGYKYIFKGIQLHYCKYKRYAPKTIILRLKFCKNFEHGGCRELNISD